MFQELPFVKQRMLVSPLISLIKDQEEKMKGIGASAVVLSRLVSLGL